MLDPFLEMMAAERGASAHTLDAYRRDLVDFGAFVRLRGRERTNADADDIRAYLASLAADGMRASTSARRLSALRQYYRFLFLEGRRTDDPTLHIDAPKKARPLPKLLSEEEIEALIAAARAREGVDGLRLTALLELFYATGLRVTELISLPLSALGPGRDWIRVRGKGNKERVVPIGGAARRALEDWLGVRATLVSDPARNRWLFPSRGRLGHLTRQRVTQLLKALAPEAGSTTPASRRTSCATPSPATSWPTAPTCGRSRRCWVTPTSPPPRSTPTSSRSTCRAWCASTTRWPAPSGERNELHRHRAGARRA